MRRFCLKSALVSLQVFLTAPNLFAGSAVIGNGGLTILCADPATQTDLEYSLDYILEAEGRETELAQVKTVEASLERIQELLSANKETLGALPHLFKAFLDETFNANRHLHFVWHPHPAGLELHLDQQTKVSLPDRCLKDGKPQLTQAFLHYRSQIKQKYQPTVFQYVPQLIERLRARPQQLSFLLVHEWLWSTTGDAELNRRLNFLVHTKAFAKMNAAQARAALEKAGLVIDRVGVLPKEEILDRKSIKTEAVTSSDKTSACVIARELAQNETRNYAGRCWFIRLNPDSEKRILNYPFTEEVTEGADGSFTCHYTSEFLCLLTQE